VHDPPHPEKIAELATFVKQFGYSLDTTAIKPKAIAALLDQVRGKPEAYLINGITLRSMTKAIYSDFNTGHFGLAFPYYAHFTSPIRRYPDLIVHRMLAEYEEGMPPARRAEYASRLGEIGEHSSLRERNAVEAERESVKYAQVEFIERHVGDEFDGVISGVTSFGFFVDLRGVFAEGLVRLRDLADDYYVFDEKNYSLRGRRAKRTFRFGDSVRVQVLRVDKDRRRIDLGLVEPARVPKRSR
jgi:ribonuclease R